VNHWVEHRIKNKQLMSQLGQSATSAGTVVSTMNSVRPHSTARKCGCLLRCASPRLSTDPSHHRLRLVGRRIPNAEENLVAGFLRPCGSERPANISGSDNAKSHLAVLLYEDCGQ
jgi:hypothetical protein